MINRRTFITTSVAGTAAAAMTSSEVNEKHTPAAPVRILNQQPGMKYRRLGNTDIQFSEISLGGLGADESVHFYGIDHGVNLVHIAWGYLAGQTIQMLGRVLKTRRDQVYVALKDDYKGIDEALQVLGTDHVDFLMFNRHKADGVKDPTIPETLAKFKQQGKVRFGAGLTTHGDIKNTVGAGIDAGVFSMVMPTLNQPNLDLLDVELRHAREKNVGIMAMKSMFGVKGLDLQTAYLKKLLSNPAVTTVNKGMGSIEMFDAFRKAINEPLTAAEDRLLYRHAQFNRANNCMMCDECREACPRGVEISTILRCRDYYYGQVNDLETARTTWQEVAVGRRSDASCADCRLCEAACPNGIHIVERLALARQTFDAAA
jgi:predicted aldo/keto reductase-like oxidoreductase